MSDLNICFVCLHNNICLEVVISNGAQNVNTDTEVKYVLPELTTLESEIPLYICNSCRTTVHSFYTFKKRCLENYNHLIQNTKIARSSSIAQDQKINELEIETYNSEPVIKHEQDVDIEFNITEKNELLPQDDQEAIVMNNMVVKEEFTVTENSIDLGAEGQCNPHLEFVKCEAVSDIEQDAGSSEEENQLKDTTHIDYQDNAKSVCSKNLSDNPDPLKQTKIYKEFKCLVCSKNFTRKSNLKTHIEIHSSRNELKCPICYQKFRQYIELPKHMVKVGHTSITDYEFALCHETFVASSILQTPLESHKRLKELKCSVCSKKFTKKYNLNMHMKIHTGVKDYNCSICNKKFIHKSNLKKHIKTHSGVKNFECSVCFKKFTQHISLQRHMVSHTSIAAFQCSQCDKKFTLKIYLQQHMKTHSGVKNFECSVCFKKFTQHIGLQRHMVSHTSIAAFQCSQCDKKFTLKIYLQKHMEKAHSDI